MKISLDNPGEGYRIRSFEPGKLCVARVEIGADGSPQLRERTLTASAIVSPDALVENWQVAGLESLTEGCLDAGLALHPEVLLVGCGLRPVRPLPLLARALNARGIGFEVMDTPAACRTYNVLMLEGRRVATALII
mgnify:CR=1 FL=1